MPPPKSPEPNSSQVLICAGEFFLDFIFFDLEHLPQLGEELKTENFSFSFGGGAAITAAAAARLNRPTQLMTVWGDTPLDAAARERLAEFGIDASTCQVRPQTHSGLTVAVSTRQDRYFLTAPAANRFVEGYLLSESAWKSLPASGHLHLALTPSDWQAYQPLISTLRRQGLTLSWDLGWDPEAANSPGFAELCRTLDVLFLNDQEAMHYTKTKTPNEALEKLGSSGNTVVVKLGKRGALACSQGSSLVESGPIAVDAVDTTGAGDAFNGGFLHYWMQGKTLQQCLLAGNICGGLSTRRPGGLDGLPSLPEFNHFWEKS